MSYTPADNFFSNVIFFGNNSTTQNCEKIKAPFCHFRFTVSKLVAVQSSGTCIPVSMCSWTLGAFLETRLERLLSGDSWSITHDNTD